jgi:hypothetical protein
VLDGATQRQIFREEVAKEVAKCGADGITSLQDLVDAAGLARKTAGLVDQMQKEVKEMQGLQSDMRGHKEAQGGGPGRRDNTERRQRQEGGKAGSTQERRGGKNKGEEQERRGEEGG